jgi:hypothetical protein
VKPSSYQKRKEKDNIAPKNIFLSILVYAHGGIPYLAILVVVYLGMSLASPQSLILNWKMSRLLRHFLSCQTLAKRVNLIKIKMLCSGCPPHSEQSIFYGMRWNTFSYPPG